MVDTRHNTVLLAPVLAAGCASASGGRLAVIEHKKEGHSDGPPEEHHLRSSDVVAGPSAAGCKPVRVDHDLLPCQYPLVLEGGGP